MDVTSAFFLPVGPGNRFCVYHQPADGVDTCRGFVYVHPFAEKMNKSRRMAALQSRLFAARGFAVLQIDLFGCGDSGGDFGEASWEIWRQDVQAAVRWLQDRVHGPISLWGLRLGATLAADIAQGPGMGIEQLLLWQPVASGEQFLRQFLRLHLAAEMLSSGAAQTGFRELRETLGRGVSLEIAGYELHPELASAIGDLKLADLVPAVKRVHWLEVGADIRCAIDRFLEVAPGLKDVVIWGLCDAASAALFYAHQDSRVTGLVLLNPWVRTPAGIAKTRLKHYYWSRFIDKEFWRKVARGKFAFATAARSFASALTTAFGAGKRDVAAGNTTLVPERAAASLPERMAEGLGRFNGRVLLILSGKDLTAQEFDEVARASRHWRKLLSASRVERRDLLAADHTFSRREWRDQVAAWTADWVRSC